MKTENLKALVKDMGKLFKKHGNVFLNQTGQLSKECVSDIKAVLEKHKIQNNKEHPQPAPPPLADNVKIQFCIHKVIRLTLCPVEFRAVGETYNTYAEAEYAFAKLPPGTYQIQKFYKVINQ